MAFKLKYESFSRSVLSVIFSKDSGEIYIIKKFEICESI